MKRKFQASVFNQITQALGPSTRTDEGLPGAGVLALPPAIRPAHHHCVVLHAPQAAGLDQVGDAVPHLGGHHHLAEALHALNLHHVLDGLGRDTGREEHSPGGGGGSL